MNTLPTPTDWSAMDSAAVEISNITHDNTHTSDLFGGELFGDELLDMYVDSGNSDVADSMSNDIPSMLTTTKSDDQVNQPNNNKGIVTGQDGLGAFHHSNSMNDFTTLLENNQAQNGNILIPQQTQQLENNTQVPIMNIQPSAEKKRTLTVDQKAQGTPPSKKRVVTVKSENNAPVNNNEADSAQNLATPDPLTSGERLAHPGDPMLVSSHIALTQMTQPSVLNKTEQLKDTIVTPTTQQTITTTNTTQQHGVKEKDLKTEESFKGVAQAAVTNLILNATNSANKSIVTDDDSDSGFKKPVDTSSAHVAALTSNNWVAACAASMTGAPPGTTAAAQAAALAAANDPAAAKAARARRATLSADERARQNRDRNREHARNTRLRKKAYVEELKRTLTELVTQRDTAELERRHEKQRDLEVREVRYRVMEEFLKLRARGSDANLLVRWVAILEDGFTLTLPKTDYRASFNRVTEVKSEDDFKNDSSTQVLKGATECLDDASKVASFITSLSTDKSTTKMCYHCDRKHFMMDDVNAVLDWTLSANNMSQGGPGPEFAVKGCMRATFSPASNKLVCAELIFDTGAVMSELKALAFNNPSLSVPCPTESTNALLDSVLPNNSSMPDTGTMCSNVSIGSGDDKNESFSDEEGQQQTTVMT